MPKRQQMSWIINIVVVCGFNILYYDSVSVLWKTAVFGSVSPNRTVMSVWFRFCHLLSFVFQLSAFYKRTSTMTKCLYHSLVLVYWLLIVYNHCGLFVKLSFIDLSLVSVFAISCTDGVKTELKNDFIKYHGNKLQYHKKIVGPKFWLSHTTKILCYRQQVSWIVNVVLQQQIHEKKNKNWKIYLLKITPTNSSIFDLAEIYKTIVIPRIHLKHRNDSTPRHQNGINYQTKSVS